MHEKSEIEASHSLLKEQMITIKQAKDQDDLEYKRLIQELKEESSSQIDEYRSLKDDFEEKL